ncbi:cysteine desulfurase family protein [Roseburia hominis]|uniref:cysteine desulfurase family protein n=1 Tax=Roseburia hominis TaxID=301301 RepID=UPI0026F347A9|nr:cysteine desulfurase family protein [Roseburia hominis]MCI7522206.1 cysteine desulfurase [Roseburia hominis]
MSCRIYMDHAATTEMLPEVREAMEPYLREEYGNASTSYEIGVRMHDAIEEAREKIAWVIDAQPEEIFFTSGGSESDNWVIKSVAGEKKNSGKHLITTRIEHHAVLRSCQYLESLGYEVTYLDVDDYGLVSAEEVVHALREDTTLVSVMTGNNEIGTLEPIADIGAQLRARGIAFHTDAVQAVGQIPLSMMRLPVDYLSASAHKFHGPKGVGFLYARKNQDLSSFIHGGSQERGKRAGTENVAGIVGMAQALVIAAQEMPYTRGKLTRLRNYFVERVRHEIPNIRLNGHPYKRLPGNVNFSIEGIDATALLVLLEEDGICASAGSACNTGQTRISHVIEAIRVPEDYAAGSVRFTMGRDTTRRDVDACVDALKRSVTILRQE